MKLFFILFTALVLSMATSAQNSGIDPRITDVFSAEQLEYLQQNDPEKIAYYTVILNDGFLIQNYGVEKIAANLNTIPKISLKPEFSSETLPDLSKGASGFNLLKFDFQIKPDKKEICRIDESGYVIVILSGKEIESEIGEVIRHEIAHHFGISDSTLKKIERQRSREKRK